MPIQVGRIRYIVVLSAVLLSTATLLQGCARFQEELDKWAKEKSQKGSADAAFGRSEANGSSSTSPSASTPTAATTPTTPTTPSGTPTTGTGGVTH